MSKILYTISLLLFIHELASQQNWTRLDHPKDLSVTDIIASSDGTYYLSIEGSQHLYKNNILDNNHNYFILPRIFNFPIDNDDNLYLNFDFDSSLIINIPRFGIYKYNGNLFYRPILKDTQEYPRVYELANIKFDNMGRLFFREGNSIYLRHDKWSSKGESKIFEQDGYIRNFFPYSDSVNYSIHSENGYANIFKFNSSDGISRKLVNLPYEVKKHSLINEKGDMLLCSGQELLYYKMNGKELIVPLIDSSINANGEVLGIFQSSNEHKLVCFKSPNFYVTSDSCRTWHKIYRFSQNIPTGDIDRFYFWDTSHALLLISKYCGAKELFVIDQDVKKWQRVVPELSNYNFSHIANYSNEFIAYHDCYFRKASNGGQTWNYMTAPNNQESQTYDNYVRVSEQNKGPIIFTSKEFQDTLYRSLDFGATWSQNTIIKRIKQVFRISTTELILLSQVGSTGKEKVDFYYTKDNGNSWEIRAKNSDFLNNIRGIKYDLNGDLILISNTSYPTIIYKSINKGLTWEIDNRFDRFNIRDIFFEKNGLCLIGGNDVNNNIGGLFATYDFKNYSNLCSKINNIYFSRFKILDDGKYVAYANGYSSKFLDRGIFYSNDYGENWNNISYNLPDFHSDEKVYDLSDMVVDDKGFLYVSLTYDGFWKYNLPLVNATDVEKKLSFGVFPNPTADCLMIKVPESFQSAELQYEISDLLGNVVLHQTHTGSAILNLSQLLTGTYILKVSLANQRIYSDKILKY